MVLLKIRFGEDVRRVTLADPSLGELRRTVSLLFPLVAQNFVLKYQDDDNDFITIKEQADVEEAWRVAVRANASRPLLRVFVSNPTTNAAPQSSSPTPAAAEAPRTQQQKESVSPQRPLIAALLAMPEVRGLLAALGIDLSSQRSVNDLSELFGRMGITSDSACTLVL